MFFFFGGLRQSPSGKIIQVKTVMKIKDARRQNTRVFEIRFEISVVIDGFQQSPSIAAKITMIIAPADTLPIFNFCSIIRLCFSHASMRSFIAQIKSRVDTTNGANIIIPKSICIIEMNDSIATIRRIFEW